jgi:MtN3 and saliva related transmembrane protein
MEGAVIAQMIGALAAIASTASFAPQAWKLIWTRDVDGLSAGMYLLTVAAFALWLAYGVLRGDWALIIPNGLCLLLSAFILLMIIVSKRTRVRIATAIEHGLQKGPLNNVE